MSVHKLDPLHFQVDLNDSNIEFLAKLVMDSLLEGWAEVTPPGTILNTKEVEERLKGLLFKRKDDIKAKIDKACEQAMNNAPTLSNRANLFGRALIEKIIQYPNTEEAWLNWFKKNYLRKFLDQVRIVMGIQNFDYFNELLDMALQQECMIRDLEKSYINWQAFFSHRRLSLMLRKARNLRHWFSQRHHQDLFLEEMNQIEDKPDPQFTEKDLWHILDAWEYQEDE